MQQIKSLSQRPWFSAVTLLHSLTSQQKNRETSETLVGFFASRNTNNKIQHWDLWGSDYFSTKGYWAGIRACRSDLGLRCAWAGLSSVVCPHAPIGKRHLGTFMTTSGQVLFEGIQHRESAQSRANMKGQSWGHLLHIEHPPLGSSL